MLYEVITNTATVCPSKKNWGPKPPVKEQITNYFQIDSSIERAFLTPSRITSYNVCYTKLLRKILDLNARRKARHQVVGDALDERSELLNQLVLVNLTGSVVHRAKRSSVNGDGINFLAQV